MLLPAAAYYNANPKKYFRCKICEGKRHQEYREAHHHNNGQICCPSCCSPIERAYLNERKSLQFAFYSCPTCERNVRFRRHKRTTEGGDEFQRGTIQCYQCLKYGCTKAGKCCIDKNIEKNIEKNSDKLGEQLDAIFNLLF